MPNAGITAFLSICFISCLPPREVHGSWQQLLLMCSGIVIAQEPFDQQPGPITPCSEAVAARPGQHKSWMDSLSAGGGNQDSFGPLGVHLIHHLPGQPGFPPCFPCPCHSCTPAAGPRGQSCRLCRMCPGTALGTSKPWQLLCSTALLCLAATRTRVPR